MNHFHDPKFLRTEQYKTSANLSARAALHQRFSTNPYGWPRWMFDQAMPYLHDPVLEVGGGPGWLWRENLGRLPSDVRVCFSDLSTGMVQEARSALDGQAFDFLNLDAQHLPFADDTFNAVLANHMLYHVPDLPRAARELARVLVPGGVLLAATNGRAHLREFDDLFSAFEPRSQSRANLRMPRFTVENAAEVLSPAFIRVEVHRYNDALWVTEAQPLVDYLLSFTAGDPYLSPKRAGEALSFFQAKIEEGGGGVRITKDAGYALGMKQ
jgi:SAM-dependent methyltransferase